MGDRLQVRLADVVTAALGPVEAPAFLGRLALAAADLSDALSLVYGRSADVTDLLERGVLLALAAAQKRPAYLRQLDRRREAEPGWFQDPRMQGYVCYTDRFCGTLSGLPERLDYLAELGVTYLHLMPLLRPRPGENDGGYAVADYCAVDPRLGSMADYCPPLRPRCGPGG